MTGVTARASGGCAYAPTHAVAGIVTSLDKKRAGQAMGLNVFFLFTGFGVGSYLFGEVIRLGFGTALAIFAVPQLLAAVVAVRLFRPEIVSSSWRCVEQAVSLR